MYVNRVNMGEANFQALQARVSNPDALKSNSTSFWIGFPIRDDQNSDNEGDSNSSSEESE